jgi:thioredoxin-like negative regulator of GroEL
VEGFSWQATYAGALERALARRCVLLVYFPPIAGNPEPPVLALAARALGNPPALEGVRVGADEVESLSRKFRVRVVPCVLLLDRRENVVSRWDGTVPRSFWQTLARVVARLQRTEAALREKADRALRLSEEGDTEGSYRAFAELVGSKSTPPDILEDAHRVEERLVEKLRLEVVRVLARDGMSGETELIAELERVRSSTAHQGMRAEIDAERERLRTTKVGGR